MTDLIRHGGIKNRTILCPVNTSMSFFDVFDHLGKYITTGRDKKGRSCMFKNLFKKNQGTQLHAPVNGKIVPLEEVPDPVFGEKMMGEGIAVFPSNETIVAPFDGEIIQVPDTKHAIGLKDKHGNEVLIHIGLETVELKGEGFTMKVQAGDNVSLGQPLMEIDLEYLRNNAKDIITPIVVTNSSNSEHNYQPTDEKEAEAGETVLLTISDK